MPISQLPMLAQDTTAATGQLLYAIEQFLTPLGLTLGVLGLIATAAAFRLGKASTIFSTAALWCVSFQLHPDALTLNILIGPLQTFRYLSKSIAFLLLGLAVLALLNQPRGTRARPVGFAAASFLAFQIYYDVQLMFFASDGAVKGLFGLLSMSFMFLVFAFGYGRSVQDPDSARRILTNFAWAGLGFVAANVVQIVAGLSGALVSGRLAGIAGNAQMMGAISTMLLLVNVYLFLSVPKRSAAWWASLICIGILPVFILWTGSRTAALASVVGLLLMFRLQAGRFALIAAVAGIVFVLASTLLQSENIVGTRFESMANTREAGWANAWWVFMQSPVVGEFPFLQVGQEPNGIESTWLRSLANMGIVGGVAVAIPFVALVVNAIRGLGLGRAHPEYRMLCDFYLGSVGAILVLNTLDGYAFGYLTFPVLYMYVVFMLGGFIAERSSYLHQLDQSEEPIGHPVQY